MGLPIHHPASSYSYFPHTSYSAYSEHPSCTPLGAACSAALRPLTIAPVQLGCGASGIAMPRIGVTSASASRARAGAPRRCGAPSSGPTCRCMSSTNWLGVGVGGGVGVGVGVGVGGEARGLGQGQGEG